MSRNLYLLYDIEIIYRKTKKEKIFYVLYPDFYLRRVLAQRPTPEEAP